MLNANLIYAILSGVMGLLFVFLMLGLLSSKVSLFMEWEILSLRGVHMEFVMLFDGMSVVFILTVLIISLVVFFYSTFYMADDLTQQEFTLIVYLFISSMILLILSPNVFSILLGWDGLGLTSYCLVIYYHNIKSLGAGMHTILINRLGDLALLLSISFGFSKGGYKMDWLLESFTVDNILLLFVLLMMGALTKSAQTPFSSWLPAAMAAPTPVSSLVHSSTLITAGVYLMLRFNIMVEVNYLMLGLASMTLLVAGISALLELDLKKVVALSTLSQVSLMIMSLSLGLKEAAFFHLLTHALFKSLLFMCVGVYIHSSNNSQNMFYMGLMYKMGSIVSLYMLSSLLSLCGAPFMAGFYSKDLIWETALMSFYNMSMICMFGLGMLLTIMYTYRLINLTMFMVSKMSNVMSVDESKKMINSMLGLWSLGVFGGSLLGWSLYPLESIFLGMLFKFILMSLMVFWVLIGYKSFIKMNLKLSYLNSKNLLGSNELWTLLIYFMSWPGKSVYILMDQGWLEQLFGKGQVKFLTTTSSLLDYMFYVFLKSSILMIIIFFILVM